MLGHRGTGRGAANASYYNGIRPLPHREELLGPQGASLLSSPRPQQSTTTIAVVAHNSRSTMAQMLASTVRPDHVAMDDGRLGCEGNHRRAWEWLCANAANSTGWSVVLEDDAQPVEGFRDQLDAALAVAPSPVVSLYLGRERPPYAQDRIARAVVRAGDRASWIVAPRLWFAVGIAVLNDLVPDLTQYLERDPRKSRPIDEAIGRWAMKHRRPVAYTWPSLVDHADVMPVIQQRVDRQRRDCGRRAWLVGGRHCWTTEAVTL